MGIEIANHLLDELQRFFREKWLPALLTDEGGHIINDQMIAITGYSIRSFPGAQRTFTKGTFYLIASL